MRKRWMTFVDTRRTVHLRDGSDVPRRLVTVVRYPQVVGAAPTHPPRRYPLVVFGHGYALVPSRYRTLLHYWARAGYVVAAPVFPGENANAVGGPTRADLVNEPADMRFVIARLLAASARRSGPMSRLIDPSRIAVAGHSDGGDTALVIAYDKRVRPRRFDATIVLAGAQLPGVAPLRLPRHGPALLAVQGDADPINPPADTLAYYRRAGTPKLLLTFPGAGHYAPYMSRGPQLTVLERVTTAFLDRTTRRDGTSWARIVRLAARPHVARLQADLG